MNSLAVFLTALTSVLTSILATTPAQALTEKLALTAADASFYTFGATATAFSLAIVVAYRAYEWVSYVFFAAFMLLTVASMDGSLQALIEQITADARLGSQNDFMRWVLPYIVYTLSTAYGCWVVGHNLAPEHPLARFAKSYYWLATLAAALPLSATVWLGRFPLDLMWIPANLLFIAMLFGQCLPPLSWAPIDTKLTKLTRTFPVVLFIFFVVALGAQWISDGLEVSTLNSVNRIGLGLCAVFALSVVVVRAFVSAKQKEIAEYRALELAQKEAKLQASLLAAERDYEKAQSLASKHQSQLATVSHDLKQPITALRMAIDGLPQEPGVRERLQQATDYIGSLAHTFLDTTPRNDAIQPNATASEASKRETVSCLLLTNSLRQMFEGDAQAQTVSLKIRDHAGSLHVQALPTMRIMSNLIGNALKHADATRILVGFRQRNGRLVCEVHDDGRGMQSETLARVLNTGERGEDSNGQGLGLAIVSELCAAQGMQFTMRSTENRGTSAYVVMEKDRSNADT